MGEQTGSPGGLIGYVRVSVPGEDGGEGVSRERGESGSDMVIILQMVMGVCGGKGLFYMWCRWPEGLVW
jgi:hypothetical protein